VKRRVITPAQCAGLSKFFDYGRDYSAIDFRAHSELYQIGRGEQGVLLVEPYKSEILPLWRFKNPEIAKISAVAIFALFKNYKKQRDFVGMDMARKFLQMGFTRARRYANYQGGRKYKADRRTHTRQNDPEKAESAEIFHAYYIRAREDPLYLKMRGLWPIRPSSAS